MLAGMVRWGKAGGRRGSCVRIELSVLAVSSLIRI
jgi:hypothetical protein